MNNNEPIFKSVFGKNWDNLPLVMRKHYAIYPYREDAVLVKGKMDIKGIGLMRFLFPLFRILKVLVPYQGKDIPVTVYLRSHANSSAFYFDRTFYIPNKKPYHFLSHMQPIKDNIVVEFMFFGIGWKTAYFLEGNKVLLKHKGYVLKLFGLLIPLPFSLLLGKVEMEKEAISDDSFLLKMEMTHPLFGKYLYAGEFKIMDSLT